jgi:hypothetical protein
MRDFLDSLENCEDCRKFGKHYEDILSFRPKASIVFHAYDICKPSNIKNLFIAEAPPWKEPKYFYNTEIYTHLIEFENDEYHSATAKTIEEAKQLIETGFEYVTEMEDIKLFRKRK